MRRGSMVKIFVVFTIFLLSAVSIGFAQTEKERDVLPRPERGIAIYTEFSGVFSTPGEAVRMELTVENKGKRDENILLKLTQVPKGWKASLKAPNYTVDAVPVPATKTKTLTFVAEPDKSMKPGTYHFQIDAQTEDGKFTSTQTITVNVRPKTAAGEDITITTSYPVLQGQTDASFEFSLEVNNKSEATGTSTCRPRFPPNGK